MKYCVLKRLLILSSYDYSIEPPVHCHAAAWWAHAHTYTHARIHAHTHTFSLSPPLSISISLSPSLPLSPYLPPFIPLSSLYTNLTGCFSFRCRLLMDQGANKSILTEDGERPLDLVDSQDFPMIALMLQN